MFISRMYLPGAIRREAIGWMIIQVRPMAGRQKLYVSPPPRLPMCATIPPEGIFDLCEERRARLKQAIAWLSRRHRLFEAYGVPDAILARSGADAAPGRYRAFLQADLLRL